MASYDTIPTPPPEDGPKPKTLKRVLTAAALASFAFGALFATAVTRPAAATQTAFKSADPLTSYIIDDCYGALRCRQMYNPNLPCWTDLHVEYTYERLAGEGPDKHGGFFCVGTPVKCDWGDTKDSPTVCTPIDKDPIWKQPLSPVVTATGAHHKYGSGSASFEPKGYVIARKMHTSGYPYDYAEIYSTECPVAFDQANGKWRCFSDDEFVASSLSADDLEYQTKRAAIAYYPDDYSMDLYGSNGYFSYDQKNSNSKHRYFYWSYATDDQEDAVYYEGVPEGDHWKLWRANEDTGGFYWVDKECDDVSTCWLKFICTQDGTIGTPWGNC